MLDKVSKASLLKGFKYISYHFEEHWQHEFSILYEFGSRNGCNLKCFTNKKVCIQTKIVVKNILLFRHDNAYRRLVILSPLCFPDSGRKF